MSFSDAFGMFVIFAIVVTMIALYVRHSELIGRLNAKEKELCVTLPRAVKTAPEGQNTPSQGVGDAIVSALVITRTYKECQERATAAFQTDSTALAAKGYFPTSQDVVPRGALLVRAG